MLTSNHLGINVPLLFLFICSEVCCVVPFPEKINESTFRLAFGIRFFHIITCIKSPLLGFCCRGPGQEEKYPLEAKTLVKLFFPSWTWGEGREIWNLDTFKETRITNHKVEVLRIMWFRKELQLAKYRHFFCWCRGSMGCPSMQFSRKQSFYYNLFFPISLASINFVGLTSQREKEGKNTAVSDLLNNSPICPLRPL